MFIVPAKFIPIRRPIPLHWAGTVGIWRQELAAHAIRGELHEQFVFLAREDDADCCIGHLVWLPKKGILVLA